MSNPLEILRRNRERRKEGNAVQEQASLSTATGEQVATATTNSQPSHLGPLLPVSSVGLSPLQHGLVMAYVQRAPAKLQKVLPMLPGILDRVPGPLLSTLGLDIKPEQKAKLAVLAKSPEEIIQVVPAEALHAMVASFCNMLTYLLELDRGQGIGTGNGSPRPTGLEQDHSSRGIEIGQVNTDRVTGTEETAEPPELAESLH